MGQLILSATLVAFCFLYGMVGANASDSDTDNKRPFFVVDPNATGPLTMEELQINVPERIANDLNDRELNCYLQTIDREITEAGDPSAINPEQMTHWDGKVSLSDWAQLSAYQQRMLLAQAIIGGAMGGCLE